MIFYIYSLKYSYFNTIYFTFHASWKWISPAWKCWNSPAVGRDSPNGYIIENTILSHSKIVIRSELYFFIMVNPLDLVPKHFPCSKFIHKGKIWREERQLWVVLVCVIKYTPFRVYVNLDYIASLLPETDGRVIWTQKWQNLLISSFFSVFLVSLLAEILMVEENFCQINWRGDHHSLYFNNLSIGQNNLGANYQNKKTELSKYHQQIAFFNKTYMSTRF